MCSEGNFKCVQMINIINTNTKRVINIWFQNDLISIYLVLFYSNKNIINYAYLKLINDVQYVINYCLITEQA